MNGAFEVGAAALRAEQRALEMHANNIANVNTPSFKRTDPRFAEVLARNADGTDGAAPDTPVAFGGVRVVPGEMLFTQGELRSSGNPLDLAISGRGMIELMGPGGTNLLWRGGRLRVNDDGLLATADGNALRAGVIVPSDTEELAIGADGVVTAKTSSGETVEIGQIGLVTTDNEFGLERLDNGFYQALDGTRLSDARPGEDGAGTLAQGSVEQSNVELTAEMVSMMMVQRAFAADAQIVQAADQLASITNSLKR
ncbi:MAG: flagellar hook basal-body protein [Candidatus Andeanibacterium colombiense]|uniref:Flagellar hook basal-body protein n=1 Tax=Candidatus Andeanibacterium colombiense TaxID=3121345 RepID=A0AAJ5X7U3_9SPHN|nr:MAG: flagellar hook basal-body protein [Sphingomonadaceae bacterium]